jgi:tetratricopeptide (TPR) repeat protein
MLTRALILTFVVTVFGGCATMREFKAANSFEEGLSLFNQGRFEEAIPYFERATRENPNFAEAYFYLGRSHVSLSRWRSAIQPLRTAFRLAPREAQGEIMTLLIDAAFAAALNDFQLGGPPEPLPQPGKEVL